MALSIKDSKKLHRFTLKIKFYIREQEISKDFDRGWVTEEIRRTLQKQVGKVGMAKYDF
jgi:hypothetical protein